MKTIYCPACGCSCGETALYCSGCGRGLIPTVAVVQPPWSPRTEPIADEPAPPKGSRRFLGVVVVLLGLICGVLAATLATLEHLHYLP